jgi:trehalose/maltose hydrolase-like predicted phosphorylase
MDNITNIHVSDTDSDVSCAVVWHEGKHRFHVWVHPDALTLNGSVIYKNHIDDEKAKHTNPARLDPYAKANVAKIAYVLNVVKELDLVHKARMAIIDEKKRKNAELLLAQIKAFREVFENNGVNIEDDAMVIGLANDIVDAWARLRRE